MTDGDSPPPLQFSPLLTAMTPTALQRQNPRIKRGLSATNLHIVLLLSVQLFTVGRHPADHLDFGILANNHTTLSADFLKLDSAKDKGFVDS